MLLSRRQKAWTGVFSRMGVGVSKSHESVAPLQTVRQHIVVTNRSASCIHRLFEIVPAESRISKGSQGCRSRSESVYEAPKKAM